MLWRKIYNDLLKWKETEGHNPLIIKGCRQCGKTFAVRQFAEEHYDNVVYINFFENPSYKDIFSGSLNVDDIIMNMTAFVSGSIFETGKTVIILDEIQECPQARTALKFFKLDGRYDIICTGSLLGVKGYGDNPASIPVGYETVFDMYPLDFYEFIRANGVTEQIISKLQECLDSETPVPDAIHIKLRELLLQYIIVGGMPRAVQVFVETKQLSLVKNIQTDIVNAYKDDMIKYAPAADKSKIRECFESIPAQLSKENKKFQYSLIEKKGTSSKFGGSLQWIEDAGIIVRCYNLSVPQLPLEGNVIRDIFKVYMADIGLLVSMLEPGTQSDILLGNMQIYKGALFENLIADIFSKMGRRLYYYHKDSGLEIDFVTRYKGECTLVEVKAVSGNAKSLKTVLADSERYNIHSAIKLGDYNVGRSGVALTLPLYMAFLLKEY